MCGICGCGDPDAPEPASMTGHGHGHGEDGGHGHGHGHGHDGDHDHDPAGRVITLEQKNLAKNDAIAAQNRAFFAGRRVLALNLVSSPGAGKTAILEHTVRALDVPLRVLEGDQATDHDAQRIRDAGAEALQINTGAGCHLEAEMVRQALEVLDVPDRSLLLVENVGNLVCPALFDLGEHAKVVVCSVTEGEDKPIKYPHMFRASQLLLLNKIDLLPHLDFDLDRCLAYAREVNPALEILQVSAKTGEGMQGWLDWIAARLPSGSASLGTAGSGEAGTT